MTKCPKLYSRQEGLSWEKNVVLGETKRAWHQRQRLHHHRLQESIEGESSQMWLATHEFAGEKENDDRQSQWKNDHLVPRETVA